MFEADFSFKQANRSASYRNHLGWEIRLIRPPYRGSCIRFAVYAPDRRFVSSEPTLYAAVGAALDAYLLP